MEVRKGRRGSPSRASSGRTRVRHRRRNTNETRDCGSRCIACVCVSCCCCLCDKAGVLVFRTRAFAGHKWTVGTRCSSAHRRVTAYQFAEKSTPCRPKRKIKSTVETYFATVCQRVDLIPIVPITNHRGPICDTESIRLRRNPCTPGRRLAVLSFTVDDVKLFVTLPSRSWDKSRL